MMCGGSTLDLKSDPFSPRSVMGTNAGRRRRRRKKNKERGVSGKSKPHLHNGGFIYRKILFGGL